jgi:hypothetical protein
MAQVVCRLLYVKKNMPNKPALILTNDLHKTSSGRVNFPKFLGHTGHYMGSMVRMKRTFIE